MDICYCQSNSIIYNILYCFNTSHVTLYQIWESSCNRNTNVSIHLMLLFISAHQRQSLKLRVSIHLMLLFIHMSTYNGKSLECFNTSHVTLYRRLRVEYSYDNKFQYISCYSLSRLADSMIYVSDVSIHLMLLFIMDACKTGRQNDYVSIHLMLLFIAILSISVSSLTSFNTSHVTLYPVSKTELEKCK